MSWSKPKTSIISSEDLEDSAKIESSKEEINPQEEEERLKDIYLFRSGRIPPYRQMFYQFKDLQNEEAQSLIRKSFNGSTCDEKSGWFLPGTDQKLRDLLTESLNVHIANENQTDLKEEEERGKRGGSDEEALSDEFEDEEEDPIISEMKFLHNSSSDEEEDEEDKA
ncbi:General transcription factor IIIC_ polypeptide 5 63kDa [Caligus rogercresseyi]|uniref:General transcription factor IIIC_ polypeptide 5 63kDa n=1 Tax=Caligus rogercresseyi TaxID=217165 RepID=A0A7T8QVN5_CALRO|nr:General transcription factor IIIC_ polypeptide 5 63kDa [Caligus rogercresseyi]